MLPQASTDVERKKENRKGEGEVKKTRKIGRKEKEGAEKEKRGKECEEEGTEVPEKRRLRPWKLVLEEQRLQRMERETHRKRKELKLSTWRATPVCKQSGPALAHHQDLHP